MNETIKQNKPVASDNAIPKIVYENNWSFNDGFLDTPLINAPKIIAIIISNSYPFTLYPYLSSSL